MRKSLILVFIAIGVGASYAAGVTEVATGTGMDDPSTWRWQVNAILTEQNVTVSRPCGPPALSTKAMSAIRPWDFSNPNETILNKRNLRSAWVDTIGWLCSFCGSGPHQIFGDKSPPNQPKTSFRVR